MTKKILTLTLIFCLFFSKTIAQETFENRAKIIATNIENITKFEKAALKSEVEALNVQLDKNEITKEQADAKKLQLAEIRAKNIETKVAIEQEKLNNLVKEKVDGKINEISKKKRYFTISRGLNDTITKSETRTTSQFVFAMGLNNVITNESVNGSDFKYFGSHFYEWGITYNSRLLEKNNLLHAKYGLSVMYNNLRATDNRSFSVLSNQTNLQNNVINLTESRLKNVYLVLPIHLEFDFSKNKTKDGKPFFKSHYGFRFGIGGYAGINLKTKEYIDYKTGDYKTSTMTKGDFNTSNFIYGLSSYIGYKETSLYIKYDLNPLFTDNLVKQNNVSLGIRFDLN
jgi:hypothetical protein